MVWYVMVLYGTIWYGNTVWASGQAPRPSMAAAFIPHYYSSQGWGWGVGGHRWWAGVVVTISVGNEICIDIVFAESFSFFCGDTNPLKTFLV